MSAIRCAITAAKVGKIRNEADKKAMERLWSQEYESLRAGGMSDKDAIDRASEATMNQIAGLAQHAKMVAQLQYRAQSNIAHDVARFKNRKGQADAGEFAQQLVNRVAHEADAMFQLQQLELGAMIHEFRRKPITGFRHGAGTRMDNVLRELFGEDTGDAAAKQFADAWGGAAERTRQLANSNGMRIAKREDWHVPQSHNALAVGETDRESWKDFIRPLLDTNKMTSPLTGKVMTASELEEGLDHAYQNIISHGVTEQTAMQGQQGVAMWRRHFDPRFFTFKDADSWLAYQKKFGAGADVFETMMGWTRIMSHDIAAMMHMGPDPASTMKWLVGDRGHEGGVVLSEAEKATRGEPAYFPTEPDAGFGAFKTNNQRLEYARIKAQGAHGAWDVFTGFSRRPVNAGWAAASGVASNLIYASALKFTTMLTGGDIVNQAMTRWFNGIPMTSMLQDAHWAFTNGFDRHELIDYGVATDVAHSVMISEAREVAMIQAQSWARGVADRAMTYSLLKPVTDGMRAMFTVGNLRALGRLAQRDWHQLPDRFRSTLLRYNIDPDAWAVIQATPVRNGLMAIKDIADTNIQSGVQPRPGLSRSQEVALRVMTMIKSEGEPAVISGTPRSARFLRARPGTALGLLSDSVGKLKSYSISHVQNHGYRMAELYWRNGRGLRGVAAGGAYMGSLLSVSMLLVAPGMMANDLAHGRDVNLADPDYLRHLFLKTISLGFFDDVLKNATDPDPSKRRDLAIAGPVVERAGHIIDFGGSGIAALGHAGWRMAGDADKGGDEEKDQSAVARKGLKILREWTPTSWATDLPVQRLVYDNIQRAIDPKADEAFEQAVKQANDQGTDYYWAPGENLPHRAPGVAAP